MKRWYNQYRYLPIKLQNQISDTLKVFLGRRERRKIENYSKEKLKEFHEAIIEDDGNGNIEDVIAKLQESIRTIDSKLIFPKADKSSVNKTMNMINNFSEVTENKQVQKRMYTYRDGEIKIKTNVDGENVDTNQVVVGTGNSTMEAQLPDNSKIETPHPENVQKEKQEQSLRIENQETTPLPEEVKQIEMDNEENEIDEQLDEPKDDIKQDEVDNESDQEVPESNLVTPKEPEEVQEIKPEVEKEMQVIS